MLISAMLTGGALASHAGVSWSVGVNVGCPTPTDVVISRPAPVVCAPAPVVVTPPPVCATPAPVVLAPPVYEQRVYVPPHVVIRQPRYYVDWRSFDRRDPRRWEYGLGHRKDRF